LRGAIAGLTVAWLFATVVREPGRGSTAGQRLGHSLSAVQGDGRLVQMTHQIAAQKKSDGIISHAVAPARS